MALNPNLDSSYKGSVSKSGGAAKGASTGFIGSKFVGVDAAKKSKGKAKATPPSLAGLTNAAAPPPPSGGNPATGGVMAPPPISTAPAAPTQPQILAPADKVPEVGRGQGSLVNDNIGLPAPTPSRYGPITGAQGTPEQSAAYLATLDKGSIEYQGQMKGQMLGEQARPGDSAAQPFVASPDPKGGTGRMNLPIRGQRPSLQGLLGSGRQY